MSKIMIVDDNHDIVETLKNIMELEGHEVETAYNGEEFLNKVKTVNPVLVLLDVMMPGLKTKEILSRLKEENLDNIKIMLVSVVKFSEEEMEYLKDNFKIEDFVSKPFDVIDLVNRVRAVL